MRFLIILATIVILVFIILTLMIYNINIHKKIQTFNNINEKITGLNILQEFMNTIGEYSSVDAKITRINEIILEKYPILKYSTIVVFDGAEYILKASNVEERHWGVLTNLANEEIFKDSISKATPKYITVEKDSERLPYQKMEFARAKSAMFFPLFIDNVYIGYWLIESGQLHAFDKLDTAVMEVIKENIVTILKTVSYQNVVENTVRTDLFTGLKSAEYLYGEGKQQVDQYTISTVCMFRITNIEEINETMGREIGNDVITDVSDLVQDNIAEKYIFVRYMGPKFVIIFSGIEPEGTIDFLSDMKSQIERLKIYSDEEQDIQAKKKKKTEKPEYVMPKVNFVITSYYKGTAMDGVTKKLEEYIDSADKKEHDINYV